MPAKDYYHDAVVRALRKDGWTIDAQQVLFIIANRHVWVDIQASKAAQTATILIEVKSLEGPSQVEELAAAVGKYTIYRAVIDHIGGGAIPLYLAISENTFRGILSEQLGLIVRQHARLRLLVFDPENEEISEWIS